MAVSACPALTPAPGARLSALCLFTAAPEQPSEMGLARHITETRKLSPENEAKIELGIQSSVEKQQKEKGKK